MAKETQKEKIERLEKELWEYKVLVSNLQKEIYTMQDKADESFENSSLHIKMAKKIKVLELENKSLKHTIEHDKKVQSIISQNKPKNERGAGRKEKETIIMYRLQGKSMREIAKIYECSVGLVHKLINKL